MDVVTHKGKLIETAKVKSESIRLDDLSVSSEDIVLISEYLLYIYINDRLGSKVVCTPALLPELITGRLLTEMGIKPESIDSIHLMEQQNKAKVFVDLEVMEKLSLEDRDIVPTCCTDNATLLRANKGGAILDNIPEHDLSLSAIKELASAVNSRLSEDTPIHKTTRSSHSCFVLKDGKIIFEAEDIGRHNAVDKAVGYIYMNDIDPMTTALFTTGRMPIDMVRKVIRASIPVLISRQQPTTESVEFAKSYGLTLIGNLRGDHVDIYSR
jgi:FdhD protein